MFNILAAIATCNDYALKGIIDIIKRVIDIIRLVVPIFLIIGGSLALFKGFFNPDDDAKAKKAFINCIASAVIVMLLPFIINTCMSIISSYGGVGIDENGSNIALDISLCWDTGKVETFDPNDLDPNRDRNPLMHNYGHDSNGNLIVTDNSISDEANNG